jgi:hypothetical protein
MTREAVWEAVVAQNAQSTIHNMGNNNSLGALCVLGAAIVCVMAFIAFLVVRDEMMSFLQ